ncbi:tRNA pseudouridine(38-40) synthase TruA [Hephaestia mangrovi]|uniref:tRNA pseudouridine(38-40) synthase TruA n=1 Tax=Hephaestia mangrovi TaxID=2873268 RepID=UPI001CA701F7|nr:tRNA pseudouridine(38-40) synthase TruA [Hephaestia mangrovi]MBY8827810.1 tRNA pseudouridine(38-40) synthase TruA [Hephaestia mangrovi]
MTRFALTIEFDGGPFMGWQRQAHGPSVQEAVERAVTAITGEEAVVHAAGRTDAGVHALAMRAHVDIARTITPFRLMEGLNALLRPDPIAILDCREVADDWHARFSCVARHYEYRIITRRAPMTLARGLAWRIPVSLDIDAMAQAAAMLVGRHDFTTFRSAHCQADSPIRTLDRLEVIAGPGGTIVIEASARSFLHHQVRSMVGCLALVGRGQWRPDDVRRALEARDRAALGLNAPPEGLYFVRADYPDEVSG